MRSLARAALASGVVAVAVLGAALPAAAESGGVYDGDDPGPGYTPLEALALFVGIPLAALVVIALCVYAPGWITRRSSDEAPREPLWLTSPSGSMAVPSGPGIIAPAGPTDHEERGGASARW